MSTAVAMALYNGETFLYKQLESIRTQTQPPDQVVFCDDGSKDRTVQIVRSYIEEHGLQDRWSITVNPQNLGYARNFFHAMSLCDADYVFLADQDDIWKKDKLEVMTKTMDRHKNIKLLSCKFEIMDENDQVMHGVMARQQKQTHGLTQITTEDLLRGFYWPGMIMCARKTFLDALLPQVKDLTIAHDRILSHCAADAGAFYDYDYVGAYHRRHSNNTAKEEHRVLKLLNLERKLSDISDAKKLWSDMLKEKLPLSEANRNLIKLRLELLERRENALLNRNLRQLIKVYREDAGKLLRKESLLCDIWLVCFGNYVAIKR